MSFHAVSHKSYCDSFRQILLLQQSSLGSSQCILHFTLALHIRRENPSKRTRFGDIAKKKKRKIIRLLPPKHATYKNAPFKKRSNNDPTLKPPNFGVPSVNFRGGYPYPVPQVVDFCSFQHQYLSQESLVLFWRALVPFSLVESLGQCAGIWRHLNFQMRESPGITGIEEKQLLAIFVWFSLRWSGWEYEAKK